MTRERARALRRNTTRLERDAWAWLRLLRDEGIAVRRQHPIGKYVADFAIMRARIVIEADGPLHERTREADAERDLALATLGWRVLRFTPAQIADGPAFLAAVRAALPPSPRGEGVGGGVNPGASEKSETTVAPSLLDGELRPAPQPPPLAGRGSALRRTRASRVLPPRGAP
ncbi:MAG: DUF559 domain-containing protein [Hyphomonadaceae bacterium]|nr:DUF559 domain-containing protein [Hyphomonadaceae bacterium]GIK49970.1 MAG: hypothetical protein BroJett013_26670 [Alphaproteobacteria bacterium]